MPAHPALRRPLAGATALAAALILGSAGAATASAQTLAGETLVHGDHAESLGVSGECRTDGPSTFEFRAFGPATGPIEGQHETYGTITLGSPTGPVTAFGVSFAIGNDDVDVAGTAALTETVVASCAPDALGPGLNFDVRTAYTTTDGITDQGSARFAVTSSSLGFASGFRATFGEPAPTMPTSKEQCFNGGWANYGFRSQGACVSYVVSRRP